MEGAGEVERRGEEGEGGLAVLVHPLVLVSISDHATREKVRRRSHFVRVVGALLGRQSGRTLELFNSFEVVFHTAGDGKAVIDMGYLLQKLEKFLTVFSDLEFLGWYSNGLTLTPSADDVQVHQQLLALNENPIFLLLDTVGAYSADKLPVRLFESEMKVVDGEPHMKFSGLPYSIHTQEAELIALDHVAHASNSDTATPGSQTVAHLSTIHEAVRMLNTRVGLLAKYLEAVEAGKIPRDLEVLRNIKRICLLLPAIDTEDFRGELLNEYNDTMLVTYLSTLTKAAATMANTATAVRVVSSKAGGDHSFSA